MTRRRPSTTVRALRRGSALVGAALLLAFMLTAPLAEQAGATEAILGEGSSWAFPAINAWQADIAKQNLTVNYNENGSAAGRSAFWEHTDDFTVSDIPFQPDNCKTTLQGSCTDEQKLVAASGRTFDYMPVVAGGTAVMYHLTIDGAAFKSLRLDSATLAGIFTGTLTSWNAPSIAALNPGVPLPAEPIRVIVRSDGSGASYQFSAYLNSVAPAAWSAFAQANAIPDAPTEFYPQDNGRFLAANGSDSVANTVAAPYSEGTIAYDETAYALADGVPVASVKNQAGAFTQPTAVAVAVALTAAQVQPDHTELLDNVYTMPDPRAYPISSYSYIIAPTNTASPFDPSKGTTLAQFINYSVCQGQQEAPPLGYSPLPPNLVAIAFGVERQIPQATPVPVPTIDACNNPTITGCWLQVNGIPQAGSCITHPNVTTATSAPQGPSSPAQRTSGNPAQDAANRAGATPGSAGGTAAGTASIAFSGPSTIGPHASATYQLRATAVAGPQAVPFAVSGTVAARPTATTGSFFYRGGSGASGTSAMPGTPAPAADRSGPLVIQAVSVNGVAAAVAPGPQITSGSAFTVAVQVVNSAAVPATDVRVTLHATSTGGAGGPAGASQSETQLASQDHVGLGRRWSPMGPLTLALVVAGALLLTFGPPAGALLRRRPGHPR